MTTKHTGDIGEHWVLYRLVKEGYTAVLAPTNAKAADILATDDLGRPFSVQVKTKRAAKGWQLNEKAERMIDPRLFYCLVDIGWDGELDPPEVYIVPSAVVARFVRVSHAEWLKGTKPNGEPRKDSPIRTIRDPHPPSAEDAIRAEYPAGWLEPYKENWAILALWTGGSDVTGNL